MKPNRYITLKCGTEIQLVDLEAVGVSYVPCGQVNDKDQPLLKFAHLWGHRRSVTRQTYGKKWNAYTTRDMTGVQLMTGFPTYKRSGRLDYLYYTSIDIERRMIENYPDAVAKIRTLYEENVDGSPCILSTKSDGLRLDAYTEYVGKKMSFKDERGEMLFEVLADKCLARTDHRYAMVSGSLLDIPTLPKETLQAIYHTIASIATEESTDDKPRTVVEKTQIGDLDIEWGSDGRSQLFPTQYCQETSHTSNRDEVRFTKHADGSVDGKCFNCGETWWEVPPKTNTITDKIIEQAPPPINIHTRSFTHWTHEERIVVKEILGVSPDAGWNEGVPAFATRYENLEKITGEFARNGQPEEVEKRRVWSTQFGKCEKCGDITAEWVDRYLLTAGRYCNSCHADTPIGSYLQWELARKLPNSIISEHQGYLGDDPEFQDFRLWQPEMLSHLGAGMATGKSTEIYKALVSLALQKMGRGIIASPRISLTRFLAHQLRKRHGTRAWGLWHEGSGRSEQYIGTYGAIVCLPSLGRAVTQAYEHGLTASNLYVAIDEVDFGYSLLSLAVHQASAVKKCLLDIFLATGLVVSGQTESTLALEAFASELGCENIQGFYNTAPRADGIVEMRKYPAIKGKNAIVLAGATESVEQALAEEHNVYVFCNSRRDGDVLADRFAEYSPVVYNSFTKGDPRCDTVLKNQRLPEDSRLFIGTSAAGVGISILDPKAKTIRVGGLTYGTRDASMGVQTTLRDRGRKGIEWHFADYNFALPMRPRETERVSLYHEEIKQLENKYAHLSENAVKKVARALALSTLADHQLETFVHHHLGEVGNMPVVETLALLPDDTEVKWVTEQRREAIKTERDEKCRLAIEILTNEQLHTRHEIRVKSNLGSFTQTEHIAHQYANGLARAVGWNDTDGALDDADIQVAVALAHENVQPQRLEKLRRGYFAVHYPKWVSAVFEKELEETTTDALNAGGGVEITAVRDDRFLGEVLKALLNRLKGEVFDSDTSLTKAIREVLDTVSQGQTLFGRIKQGGLGAQAYRRSRFLKTAGDTYVINWARTFIKEFYPATLSKRGNSYSLVHDKRTDLLLSSFKCWLSQHIEAEPPKLTTAFDALEPQVELKEQVRERRKSGELLETIADEFNISIYTASQWCKDIKVLSPTETQVMDLLGDGQVWRTSEIQKHSTFTRQAVTIALNNLLEKGTITKIKRGHYQKLAFDNDF